jgi:ubiquitin-protein ligase
MATRRLSRELAGFQGADADPNITAAPKQDDDLFAWRASFKGPDGTPFAGGTFFIDLAIPQDYPHRPPTVTFATTVFHPQINAQGGVCLPCVNAENWTSTTTIKDVIVGCQTLLGDPVAANPYNIEAGELLGRDKAAYDAKAREFVQRYAM